MPALKGKDLGGGPWFRRSAGGRISRQLCPVCRTPLHEELVARGIATHPCCQDEQAYESPDCMTPHDTC